MQCMQDAKIRHMEVYKCVVCECTRFPASTGAPTRMSYGCIYVHMWMYVNSLCASVPSPLRRALRRVRRLDVYIWTYMNALCVSVPDSLKHEKCECARLCECTRFSASTGAPTRTSTHEIVIRKVHCV